ncbi:cadherin-like domain-containing protein [Oleispirillum naphthae]|uniref:cadherin-like domain-containing protein n=1 Tax=Oleispirillum naphthae TaxID=2838853 RepID=UPI0030822A82
MTHLRLLALEPRILLDAAGVATVAAADPNKPPTATEAAASTATSPENSGTASSDRSVAVIDSRVANADQIIAGLSSGTEVVMIGADDDGAAVIQSLLGTGDDVATLAIFAHGGAGELTLGSDHLTMESLGGASGEAVAAWAAGLSGGADILIYACDVAEGAAGDAFIHRIADLTGADVAASTDDTGSTTAGGNWTLEAATGVIAPVSILSRDAMDAYDGLLSASPVVADADGSTRTIIESGTLAISGLSLSDADSDTVTVTLHATTATGTYDSGSDTGTLTLDGYTGAGLTIDGAATATLTVSGTLSDVNTALTHLTYTSNSNVYGTERIALHAADADGNTGDLNVAVRVTTAPVLADSATSTRTLNENTGSNGSSLTFSGLSVSDADATTMTVTVHATDASGTYSSGADTGTLSFGVYDTAAAGLAVTGSDTGNLTITGSASAITTALSHLIYVPTQYLNGTERIALYAADTDGNSNSLNVAVRVTSVNESPTLVPSALTVQEGTSPVGCTAANFNLSDPDLTTGNQISSQEAVKITSLPTNGTLTYNGSAVVVGTVITYDKISLLVYTPNGSDVNPDNAATTSDSFTVTVNDGGGSGDVGPYTIAVTLTPKNVKPTIGGSPSVWQSVTDLTAGTSDTAVGSSISISDADAYDQSNGMTKIVISGVDAAGQGTFYLDVGGNGSYDAATDVTLAAGTTYTFLKSGAAVYLDANDNGSYDAGTDVVLTGTTVTGAVQGSLRFLQNGSAPGSPSPSFIISATDAGGGEGDVAAATSTDTKISVTVKAVDQDPILVANTGAGVDGGDSVTLTTAVLQVTDVDTDASQLVYTLTDIPDYGVVQIYADGGWHTLGVGGRFTQNDIDSGHVRYIEEVSLPEGTTTDSFTFQVRDSTFQPWPTADRAAGVSNPDGTLQTLTFALTLNGSYTGGDGPSAPDPAYVGDLKVGSSTISTVSGTAEGNSDVPVADGSATDATEVIASANLTYVLTSQDDSYTVPAAETVYTITSLPANGSIELYNSGTGAWTALPAYSTFSQADIDAGSVRFHHNGGEVFSSTLSFNVSAGNTSVFAGSLGFVTTPVNDAPGATGATLAAVPQGSTVAIAGSYTIAGVATATAGASTLAIRLSDADGAVTSGGAVDAGNRVGEGTTDFLYFQVADLPDNGTLQRWDGAAWVNLTVGEWLPMTLLTAAVDTVGTADDCISGLRYVNYGSAQSSAFTDSFVIVTRDDLANPGNPFSTAADAVTASDYGAASGHSSSTATVGIKVARLDQAPIVPTSPDDPAQNQGAGYYLIDQNGDTQTPANQILTVSEGGSGTITGSLLTAADADNTAVQVQYRIVTATQYGTLYLNGQALGIGSTFTQADIDADLLTYTHNGSEHYSDNFTFVVSDSVKDNLGTNGTVNTDAGEIAAVGTLNQDGSQADAGSPDIFKISVTSPVNEKPTLTLSTSSVSGSGTIDLSGIITIGDPDLPGNTALNGLVTDYVRVTVSLLDEGVNYADGATWGLGATDGLTFVSGANGGDTTTSLVIEGTIADVQAALSTLSAVLPAGDLDKQLTVQVTVDDRLYDGSGEANGGATNSDSSAPNADFDTVSKSISIYASGSNDAPVITSLGAQTVAEDTGLSLAGLSVADADGFDRSETLTVSVLNGTLTFGTLSGITVAAGANGTSTVTLSGNVSRLNAALASLSYKGSTDYNGTDTLSLSLSDNGNTGGAAQTDSATVAITVTPVNDTPTIDGPDGTLYTSTGGVTFSAANGNAITIGDAKDVGQTTFTDTAQVTVSVPEGTLTLGGTAGITISGGADGSSSITITGTIGAINTALNGLTYLASAANQDSNAAVNLSVAVDDLNDGSSVAGASGLTAAKIIPIASSAANDVPTITAPAAASVNEDSSVTIAGVSVGDVDAFGEQETVTVTVSHGALSLASSTGLTVTGSGTATLTLTGTLADLNSALAGLKYTPTANWFGSDSMAVSINDLGHSGGGGAQTGSKTIAVTVNAVNDRPVASGSETIAATTEGTATASATLADLLGGHYTDATDNQTAHSGGDTSTALSYVAIVGSSNYTAAQGTWQVNDGSGWIDIPASGLSATNALVFAASADIRFVPAADYFGTPGTLSVRLSDGSTAITASTAAADTKNLSADGGTGATNAWSAAAVTIGTSVTNVNDAPTAATTTLSVAEDTASPAGGTVSALFGSSYSDATDTRSGITGGGDAATALGGIAIVGNAADAATQGVWQYDTGSGWVTIGAALNDTTALILPTTASLRFVPVADYFGAPGGLTVRLADSVQAFSAAADISGATGATGTWSATAALTPTVTAVNDRPVASGSETIAATTEGTATASATLADLLGGHYTDAADNQSGISGGGDTSTALSYVAIVGSSNYTAAQGTWQVNGGSGWIDIPASGLSATNALVFAASADIRFVPAADYFGTPGTLSVRLSDGSTAITASTAAADTKNLSADGGTGATNAWSAAAVTIGTSVTNVNDAPTAATTTLSVAEDTASPAGGTVSALFGSSYSDATDTRSGITGGGDAATALGGIAIVGNAADAATQGVWQYDTGSGWVTIGAALNDTTALILPTTASLRFVPVADYFGAPGGLTVRLADSVQAFSAAADISGATGATGTWSATAALTPTVTAVNDRPVASATTLADIAEDTASPAGSTVSALFGTHYSDATDNRSGVSGGGDASTALGGVAIVGNTADATTQGVWQYDTGSGWVTIGSSMNDTAALVLPTTAGIRFVPVADYNGTPGGLTVRLADSVQVFSASADISSGTGTTGTWSNTAALSTGVTPVNDAPAISASSTLLTVTALTGGGTSTGFLLTGASDSDVDVGLSGVSSFGGGTITVTLTDAIAGDVLDLDNPALTGIASVGGGGGAPLVITLNADATAANVATILNAIQYHSSSADPTSSGSTMTRSFRIVLNDGNNDALAGGPTSLDSNLLSGSIHLSDNRPPTAVNDTNRIDGESSTSSLTGSVTLGTAGTGTDTDPDGDTLTVISVNGDGGNVGTSVNGTYGTVTINANGTYTYALNRNGSAFSALGGGQSAAESFAYTISDGFGGTSSATLTIAITGASTHVATPTPTPTPPIPDPTPTPLAPSDQSVRTLTGSDGGGGDGSGLSYNDAALRAERLSALPLLDDSRFIGDALKNPIQLALELQDRVLPEGLQSFAIPPNAFVHSDPVAMIHVEATQADGSQLPSFITFDKESRRFVVDTDYARNHGIPAVEIRVTGRDSAGNRAAATFHVTFTDHAGTNRSTGQLPQTPPPPDRPTESPQERHRSKLDTPARHAPGLELAAAGRHAFIAEREALLADLAALNQTT